MTLAVEFRLHPSSIMTLKSFLLDTDEVGRVFHHCDFDLHFSRKSPLHRYDWDCGHLVIIYI